MQKHFWWNLILIYGRHGIVGGTNTVGAKRWKTYTNSATGFTHRLDKGFDVGVLEGVLTNVDTPIEDEKLDVRCDKTERETVVNAVSTVSERQHKVCEIFQNNLSLPELEILPVPYGSSYSVQFRG